MNIVITSTTSTISVAFNIYSNKLGMKEGTWSKSNISSVILVDGYTSIYIEGEKEWRVSFDGIDESFIIDTIDGVALSDNRSLYDVLKTFVK